MRNRFTGRGRAIVALDTVGCDTGVIKPRTDPSERGMTGVAFRGSEHVRCALAAGRYTVVATCTRTDDLCMINTNGRPPTRRRVAGFTKRAGGDVGCSLSTRADSVMALDAITVDAGVIETRTKPGGRHVA